MARLSWDDYFLEIAKTVALRADCRRARYGAVIVKDHRIVSTGYNGAPSGKPGCLDGACPRGLLDAQQQPHNEGQYENCISLHAETNAIAYADGARCVGATLFIAEADGRHRPPCGMCSKLIQAAGIIRVVIPSKENGCN